MTSPPQSPQLQNFIEFSNNNYYDLREVKDNLRHRKDIIVFLSDYNLEYYSKQDLFKLFHKQKSTHYWSHGDQYDYFCITKKVFILPHSQLCIDLSPLINNICNKNNSTFYLRVKDFRMLTSDDEKLDGMKCQIFNPIPISRRSFIKSFKLAREISNSQYNREMWLRNGGQRQHRLYPEKTYYNTLIGLYKSIQLGGGLATFGRVDVKLDTGLSNIDEEEYFREPTPNIEFGDIRIMRAQLHYFIKDLFSDKKRQRRIKIVINQLNKDLLTRIYVIGHSFYPILHNKFNEFVKDPKSVIRLAEEDKYQSKNFVYFLKESDQAEYYAMYTLLRNSICKEEFTRYQEDHIETDRIKIFLQKRKVINDVFVKKLQKINEVDNISLQKLLLKDTEQVINIIDENIVDEHDREEDYINECILKIKEEQGIKIRNKIEYLLLKEKDIEDNILLPDIVEIIKIYIL